MPNNKISVLIPSYNEEENILLLIQSFDELLKERKLNAEVILIDDGSTDGTYERVLECKKIYPFLKVIRHRTNLGLTEALKTGFKKASGDILVFYPADLQYDPKDMPLLLEKLSEGYDLVTGWKEGYYGVKGIVSFFYNNLSRWLFGIKVHDLNSVKAFKREVADSMTLQKDWHRYFVILAADRGFKISEVKMPLYPRKYGKSKFGISRIPIGMLDMLSVKFFLTFMKKPMLLFGSAGVLFVVVGFITGIYSFYMRFVLLQGFRPLLTFVVLCVLSGIVLFSLGFILEVLLNIMNELDSIKQDLKRAKDEKS